MESEPFIPPYDWPSRQKWTNVILISFQATFTPIASTLLAETSIDIARDYGLTDVYTPRLPFAVFVLAQSLGPLYLAPLSEMYGRRPVYIINFALFVVFNIACAVAPNIIALSIFRFCSGLVGSASTTLSGATVGDMFIPAERGRAQSLYSVAPLLGPVIGGVLAGYITYGTGTWRWTMWLMAIASGVSVVSCFFFMKETYRPLLEIQHKTKGKAHTNSISGKRFQHTLLRPLRLLLFSPACTIVATITGLGYAIFFFHLITIPLLYGPIPQGGLFSYRWAAENTGLAYLGAGVGSIIGLVIATKYSNQVYLHVLARIQRSQPETSQSVNDTNIKNQNCPEARLPFAIAALALTPVGLIIFAWTIGPTISWVVPLIGAAVFSVGMIIAHVSIMNYLVDAYGDYAASSLAAISLFRNVLACVLTLVGYQAYESLGYTWGTMLLAIVMAALLIGPVMLYIYGRQIRTMGRNS